MRPGHSLAVGGRDHRLREAPDANKDQDQSIQNGPAQTRLHASGGQHERHAVSGEGNAGLHEGGGQEAGTTISILVGPSSDTRWIGSRDEGGLGESRHEQHGLLWSQLPNWSSDGSCPGRDWGRDDPETGALEEQCLQAVCAAGAGRAGMSPAEDGQ